MLHKIGRRGFIAGGVAIAGLAGVGMLATRAATAARLRIDTRILEVSGRAAKVFTIVGPDGRPGIDTVLGQPFRYLLENASDEDALIHWHGLKPPSELDGVPVLSQAALPDGASFLYDFVNTRSGTHWMHSHVGLQEQRLMAAPLIVRETAEPVFDEREHVVMVHDFTFRDPAEIFAELKSGGGAHAGHTTGGMDNSKMDMSTMDMGGTLNDVAFDAYLANDRTLDDPEVVTVEKGGKVRLRIINAAAASNLWIDLGGIEGELVAVDGNPVHAMPGQRFPLAIAQRADIRLQIPAGGGVFPILFRPEGVARQTGILLASKGAAVSRMASEAEALPGLDLELESRLRPVGSLADEPVTRTETVMLTGGGADYLWGLNGVSSAHQTIFTVRRGERLAVMLHNMTGMAHPMHLHGHYFKVTAIDGRAIDGALRDTVLVPPKTTVTIQFDADNPGTWAFHCHHIYHMNSGMMGAIAYSSTA